MNQRKAQQVQPIEVEIVGSITAISSHEWDSLVADDDPFLEHAFLAALEVSGSVGAAVGCEPLIVVARRGGRLIGAVPLYLKTHSYGEYIFDWAWADAAQRAGIAYYPKLVAAVPFTPSSGQRILTAADADREAIGALILRAVRELADVSGASSIHFLFCTEPEAQLLAADRTAHYDPRLSMQFHWENRQNCPFDSFDEFLLSFRSRNRKQVRRERATAAGYGLTFRTATGDELSANDWAALQSFYSANVNRHRGIEYLKPAFFEIIRETLRHRLVATLAYRGTKPVAGTINFEKGGRLYGRYWGSVEELEMLHFELCYYQLIERAIERRYARFEAGAQGEHKLKRGLLPKFTHSAHWIRHTQLAAAVSKFITAERAAIAEHMRAYAAQSPFRDGTNGADVGGAAY